MMSGDHIVLHRFGDGADTKYHLLMLFT